MNRPQWITLGIALVLTIALYAATQKQLFGAKEKPTLSQNNMAAQPVVTIDSILVHAKESLPPEHVTRLNFLENSISRGDVAGQKIHLYHQLARYWADSARIFEPYAWYTAEAARLENSEKSLTFAAHLFLDNLKVEENPALKRWKALQAKDLFERSLKVNSGNDSTQVGLGETYLYGGIGEGPMEGITKIREVAEKDTANVYAQLSLGRASVMSGQYDKAVGRFLTVLRHQPQNLEAMLLLAESYEQKGDKADAVAWYRKSLPLINIAGAKKEVEARIDQLSK